MKGTQSQLGGGGKYPTVSSLAKAYWDPTGTPGHFYMVPFLEEYKGGSNF